MRKNKKLRSQFFFDSVRHRLSSYTKVMMSLFLAVLFCGTAIAQEIEISGTVTTTGGETLPGVSIALEGTQIGTTTDLNGNYTIDAPENGVLVFSFVGFQTVREQITGRTNIDITMEETIANLDELIVTGYSSQRRGDVTGAVASVDIESVERETSASVLQRLDGRVPGVTVQTSGSPGARNTVRIRGISSFQNNDPLYIIDGTPVQDSYANWLNPADIESIQVLKDASAASIYGSRANNGVIIIETKTGSAGAPQVNLNVRTGIAQPIRGYDDFVITDALQYHEVIKRSYENAGQTVPTNIYGDPNNPSIPNYIWPNDGTNQTMNVDEGSYSFPNSLIMPASSGTNWWDEVFGNALQQNYNISVAGGSDSHNYNVSFNYLDQEGTAAYNRFQRGTVRVNTEFDLGLITIGENVSVATEHTYGGIQGNPGGYAEGGIIGKNILMQPVVPVKDINGWWASGKAVGLGNQSNPLKSAFYSKEGPSRNNRIFGNVFGRFDVQEKVLVTSRLGFNLNEGSYRFFNPVAPENSEPSFTNGIGEGNYVNTDWTWTNTLQYIDQFAGVHNVDVLVGHEANEFVTRSLNGSIGQLLNTNESSRYIQDALADPGTKNVNSGGFKSSLLSFFGKVAYNYDQRYFLDLTVRRDGSSRLGSTNRWGTFPAASLGWRVSNESFLQDSELISNLMIRAGYGVTGNQQIPSGRTVNQYGGSVGDTFYNIGGDGTSVVAGYRQVVRGNPNLKWEENESINVGVDLEMFDGRFNFALDVYQRDTNDLLFAPQLPASAGFAAPPIVNIGQMRNTGFDFTLGTRGTVGTDLNWTLSFNGSTYKNEIRKIDGTTEFFFSGTTIGRHGFTSINQLGKPIGSFYGLKTDGIFMNEAEVNSHVTQDGAAPGRLKFVDVNGDGNISAADETIIGNPHPDFTGGLDIGLQYKSWDLNTTFFASIGNEIYDVQKEFYIFRTFSTTVREDLLTKSAVVENGQVVNNPKYPRIDLNDTFSGGQPSDFYVEDGSYLRLRNLQIGYTLPGGVIPGLRNARIYVQGENLFTITGYDGLDPSLPARNISGGSGDTRDQYMGIDSGAYPSNRIFSLGINASF
ncbi:SusC/RagA family TonB-linked outer membrane protein [Rhodohalobacter sulfatireducens]|uniref:TonB-dependent receptor n=1 Tax=Rhodohalobacter sulfatireducens TaxID=2911366 RepID=A0ABS9KB02_9BACT|nr:TonB-dependent receptor [Rhodohalobacter sulfatireducens]MCG2588028.1 TonB-dependent receptor [Rhodohalobacter sulfatireducens]